MKMFQNGSKIAKNLIASILGYFRKAIFDHEYIATHHNIKSARRIGVKVGNNCRFFSMNFSTEPSLIEIGDHVTITNGVEFITHDGGVWVFREEFPDINLFGKIIIGSNVFIGLNSIILPNTEVGENTIIAAGSVVKGKFEDNSVIGGIPARKICSIEDYYNKNSSSFLYNRK